ncbi:S8 family serine peptidase [Altererythrobacter aurantiacus]|uniref:S8 family serine peptidase n=1 Tax=Parapontixanthobacter aurantiacus TaxID=1463599 RepID=A0A844ZA73_9SPHN|nr:S8 family serine peptidase [Parapontixanthobacter aurantiacus]MXO84805.1 S8 family serine peptidase [Parapontixanthobacter aurantiacus]
MTMKMIRRTAGASVAVLGVALAAAPASAQKIENSYICVFKSDKVAKGQTRDFANKAVRANGGSVKFVYKNTIRGFAANISPQGLARMQEKNPNIAYCEQDQVMQIVQRGKPDKGGGGTTAPAQVVPWGITRVKGGQDYTGAGRAWIIDSGVDLDHADLNVNVPLSTNFTSERDADDGNGHGTHVAGTIAAINNDIGVVGVAAGAEVVGVKVLGRRGSGSNSGVIAGVDYVGANAKPGDVANMSLGGGASSALDNAILAAAQLSGASFTLAAGNESQNANNVSPARVNGNRIYTVSAFSQGDRWASFSNFANPPIDFAEPGVAIGSTYKDGGYATLSGTSMAAPHLAGILLWGAAKTDGTVIGDPDGQADTIGTR